MGLFDYITCDYPIDAPESMVFQTKDTVAQNLETYKIGTQGDLFLLKKECVWQENENCQATGGVFSSALKPVK